MIRILTSDLTRLGVIKSVTDSTRLEELNGENTLDFSTVLNSTLNSMLDENTVFELNADYFDIGYLKKDSNEDGTYTVEVEAEHVSYRLNKEEYNVDFFTEQGTPTVILGKILEGTGFTVGTVAYEDVVTYSLQEATSRRQLLMEFVAYLGGEVEFNKFVVNIVTHRGSQLPKPVIKGKNVNVVRKILNKRDKDKNGNYLVSYECKPIFLPGDAYSLGDDLMLVQKDLGIDERLRVVSIAYNPYDIRNVTFKIGNYVNSLANSLYGIETISSKKLSQNKAYNGCKIGPENGFEVVMSDNKARAFFNSEAFKMQRGDGTGDVWDDAIYFDTASGKYKFVGDIVMQGGSISWDNIDPETIPPMDIPTDIVTTTDLTTALQSYVTTGNMTAALANYLTSGSDFSTIITKDFIASMNLIVGNEIKMGDSAKISWTNVTDAPIIPVDAADIGALPDTYAPSWASIVDKPVLLTQAQLETELADYVTTGSMSTALANTLTFGNFSTAITKNYIASMNLIVGQEITMGANAKISWVNVTDAPTIPTDQTITTITQNAVSTATVRVDQLTGNDVQNPIIELFANGASLDATANNKQGIGNSIRLKWDDTSYVQVSPDGIYFYTPNVNQEAIPNIQADGFYLGSVKCSAEGGGGGDPGGGGSIPPSDGGTSIELPGITTLGGFNGCNLTNNFVDNIVIMSPESFVFDEKLNKSIFYWVSSVTEITY